MARIRIDLWTILLLSESNSCRAYAELRNVFLKPYSLKPAILGQHTYSNNNASKLGFVWRHPIYGAYRANKLRPASFTPGWAMLDDRLCLRRGSFYNYVDQILPNCDHHRVDKCGHFTYAYYFLFTWPCVDFLLTTYPPTYLFLVHVDIEWACGERGPPTHIKLRTLIVRHNQKCFCFHFLF